MDLLPGWYDDWVIFERERIRQRLLHAVEALSRRLVETDRFAEAVDAAVSAVSADPLRESANRVLMEAHLAEGNLIEAHRTYKRYRDTVRRELGVEPGEQLTSLLQAGSRPNTLNLELHRCKIPAWREQDSRPATVTASWRTGSRCSVADADKAAEWLAANVCEKERQAHQVREELVAHLKGEQIEPPARDRIRRIIGTALRQAEQALTARIASRVPAEAAARMLALIARAADPGDEDEAAPGEAGALFGTAEVAGVDVFAAIRDEPGNVSVKTIGQEAFKLGAIRAAGLPDDLFADVAPKVLAGWRARVAAEAPSHLRSHPPEIMVTLLAAYLYCRQREITDALTGHHPTHLAVRRLS